MWTKKHFVLIGCVFFLGVYMGTRWFIKYGILFAVSYMLLRFTGFPILIPVLAWMYFKGFQSLEAVLLYLNMCRGVIIDPELFEVDQAPAMNAVTSEDCPITEA